jgi:hypothetical protein
MSPTDCIVPHVCLLVNLHVVLFVFSEMLDVNKNAWAMAAALVRREEDKKYDLKQYLRKNPKLAK